MIFEIDFFGIIIKYLYVSIFKAIRPSYFTANRVKQSHASFNIEFTSISE